MWGFLWIDVHSSNHCEHAQVHVESTLVCGYWLTENRCSNYLDLNLGPKKSIVFEVQ